MHAMIYTGVYPGFSEEGEARLAGQANTAYTPGHTHY